MCDKYRISEIPLHVKNWEYALHTPCGSSTSATPLEIQVTTIYGVFKFNDYPLVAEAHMLNPSYVGGILSRRQI